MAWLYLLVAAVFEVVWALAMKAAEGWTRLGPSLLTVGGMLVSFWFLSQAARTLPIGTAYAVWTGIGALGTVVMGIVLFHEPVTPQRLVFLGLLLAGIVGLKATA